MTAPTEKVLNYGLRYAAVYELNANGTPKGVDHTTAYEGLQFKGSTAFEVNIPDARKLTGLGEDGITQVVFLPPQEGADGVLNVEASDQALIALLDGTKAETLGEVTIMGGATNQQGFEPQVGLMLYQAARGLDTGKTYWRTIIIPSAQVVRKPGSMTAEKSVTQYQVAMNRTSKHLWGPAFSKATNGFTHAQFIEVWSNYPLRLASFVGNNSAVEFSFPVASPAVSTDGVVVFVNGAPVTTGITKTVTKVTFDAAPAAAARIDILREISG